MAAHDAMLSARAELPCYMPEAPSEYWSCDLGQVPVNWAMCADVYDDGEDEVLAGPAPLVCSEVSGEAKWRAGAGQVVSIADINGDGLCEILVGCGDGKVRAYR